MPVLAKVGLLVCLVLAACSKTPEIAAAQANESSGGNTATAPAKDDACGLLSRSEVRDVLPEAAKAVREDNLVAQGINGCSWYPASGKAPVLEVRVWQVSGADDTPLENAKTFSMGFADPLRNDAQSAIRLEKIAGVGEDAVAIVEKAEAARGILTTGALLALQKNGKIVMLASSDIATRERPAALGGLTALGKAAARRL